MPDHEENSGHRLPVEHNQVLVVEPRQVVDPSFALRLHRDSNSCRFEEKAAGAHNSLHNLAENIVVLDCNSD